MTTKQDAVYLNSEADNFFIRNSADLPKKGSLRSSKQSILDCLETCTPSLKGSKVLEIGPFVGDLLSILRDIHGADVYGVEASTKACQYALNEFSLKLENTVFSSSSYFGFSPDKKGLFDIIIIDDVFGWLSRENILQVVASIDWLVATSGVVFIRDYYPTFPFCYRNHHVLDADVYSYKLDGGHASIFLKSGNYYTKRAFIDDTAQYQITKTTRPDSSVWADTLLKKLDAPLHPELLLQNE